MMLRVKQVTIVGTGLLGASLALALRGRGFSGRIVGVGRRKETLEKTRTLGCFDGLTVSTAEALHEASSLGNTKPHLAVIAAPLGHFQEIFAKIAGADDGGLIVTDVGSTKATVCRMAADLLPDASRFVGSHPMAGSEQQGPDAADEQLFEGKPCVVTPQHDTDDQAIELVESVWKAVGMRLVRMSPTDHDRNVALISHLPHAVAALLVQVAAGVGGDGVFKMASTGFGDTTRIAAGDPGLWVDIFRENREAFLNSVDHYESAMKAFRELVKHGDDEALMNMLEKAKQARDAWGAER